MKEAKNIYYFCLIVSALFAIFSISKATSLLDATTSTVEVATTRDPSNSDNACIFCAPKNTSKPKQICETGRKWDIRKEKCMKMASNKK